MYRVDVHNRMADKQFAGVAGALFATLVMCGPTAVVAYYVSRLRARRPARAGLASFRPRWYRFNLATRLKSALDAAGRGVWVSLALSDENR
jgi:hypothetical protein